MKKGLTIIKVLLFSAISALFFKWWTTGDPFQISTVLFGTIILFIILTSLFISSKLFRPFLNIPVKQLRKRIGPAFILFLFIILLVSLLIIGLSIYIFYLIMGLDTSNFLNNLFEVEFPGAIKYYFICALVVSSFFFYNTWKEAIAREQQLREQNLKYRYRTLKTQVNPHFLFNSLNTLSEIVYTDAQKADDYIQRLAGIYRFILDHEETDLLPLNEELGFVKQYFSLHKERNNDKIELAICVENADKYRIIPISLQILIENALKHNSVSEEKPLKIDISIVEGYIVISNNIQKRTILNNSPGTGLLNLKERVKLIMDKDMIVSRENDRFTVKLPIIRD